MQHRTQNDLETAIMTSTGSLFRTPEGLTFGWGTTVGNGIEGWAPGAIFIDTNGTDGAQLSRNDGTITTADWVVGGSIVSDSATLGIGYATGAGGAETQITSKSTGVTLSKPTGTITTHNASLTGGAEVAFTVTNTLVAATDIIVLSIKSGPSTGVYVATVTAVAAGSFEITLANVGATASEVLLINFALIKGVAA